MPPILCTVNFFVCLYEYPESQPKGLKKIIKKTKTKQETQASGKFLQSSYMQNISTAATSSGGNIRYLKRFKEASSSSTAAVLHLIVVSTQTHHGLTVYVQLFVQSLQQGRTRPLLLTVGGVSFPSCWIFGCKENLFSFIPRAFKV